MTTYRQLLKRQSQDEYRKNHGAYFELYRVALWWKILWFIETCPYMDNIKDDKNPGTLSQEWIHGITLFRHGHTYNTPWSKITGTYKVIKRTFDDGTEPAWWNGHLIFSHGTQAQSRSQNGSTVNKEVRSMSTATRKRGQWAQQQGSAVNKHGRHLEMEVHSTLQ